MPRLIDANEIPWCSYDLDNYHWFEGVDKEVVDEMPTIDPESLRPHGRWEEGESGFLVCSECADVFILEEWLADGKWKYCPNCGAKMDEEEEDK